MRIGSKVLLEHASAHISDGQKVGLVGANGCGKSTLFRVLKGELETETGSVFFPNSYRVVFVEQEMRDIDVPILDFLLSTDRERTELQQRLETASGDELAEIHERLNMIEAASAPARAAGILHGLRLQKRRFVTPDKGVLRRLAHASGFGCGPVSAVRSPVARRTDQSPRFGSRNVAGKSFAEISRYFGHHQP